jgi:hypothetical protein
VRRIECWGFADSCVDLQDDSKTTTVMDCSSYDQASIITGGRRYSFNSDGVLNLVKGCYARNGRHDYVSQGGGGHGELADATAALSSKPREQAQERSNSSDFDATAAPSSQPRKGAKQEQLTP